jgi:hypothetical protein
MKFVQRLYAVKEEYLVPLMRDDMWSFDDEVTGKLRSMSVGTMKNRIAPFPRIVSGGGRSMTKPSDLKELISIRRGPWENPDPGFVEIDTVAHCGNTGEGLFASGDSQNHRNKTYFGVHKEAQGKLPTRGTQISYKAGCMGRACKSK